MRQVIRLVSSWRCSAPYCFCSCTTPQPATTCWGPPRLRLRSLKLELEHYKLGGLDGRKAHQHVNDSVGDVILRSRGLVAIDEECLTRRGALERALDVERIQECFRGRPD